VQLLVNNLNLLFPFLLFFLGVFYFRLLLGTALKRKFFLRDSFVLGGLEEEIEVSLLSLIGCK